MSISHGRGGAGNITPDETPYADGGIVREGPLGDQGDGSYSAGVCLPILSLSPSFSHPLPFPSFQSNPLEQFYIHTFTNDVY